MENVQQNQGQGDAGKVEKKFEQNMHKLMALLKGDEKAFKTKVPNGEIEEVIQEMLKDRRAATIKTFKEKASAILDSHVEFNKFCKQKEKEFKDSIVNKKKEFSKQMEECFNLIENMDTLAKDYKGSLTELSAGTSEDETSENQDPS